MLVRPPRDALFGHIHSLLGSVLIDVEQLQGVWDGKEASRAIKRQTLACVGAGDQTARLTIEKAVSYGAAWSDGQAVTGAVRLTFLAGLLHKSRNVWLMNMRVLGWTSYKEKTIPSSWTRRR